MNLFLIFLSLIIIMSIFKAGFNNVESFDGIGKSFGQFFFPKKCCKSTDCYPGMYVGPNFYNKNHQ
jgi:hypothetical protein